KWSLDKDTLKRLQRHDTIGDGYTLFLPWGTYRPDIDKVHLNVTYTPTKGTPLYSASSTIALGSGAPTFTASNRTVGTTGPTGTNPGQPANPGTAAPAPSATSQVASVWPPSTPTPPIAQAAFATPAPPAANATPQAALPTPGPEAQVAFPTPGPAAQAA